MTSSSAPQKKFRPLLWLFGLGLAAALIGVLLIGFAVVVISPNLPALDALTDYRPKIPLRIYTFDNALIGEFGQERRDFVPAKEMPLMMKQALLAVEDARFYEHGGVDFKGVMRAIVVDLTSRQKQGASTITMQVARDFFLSKEKVLMRKLTEAMLAYRIEEALSKEQILELYMNQVYLGQRAYGFGAASRIYFGKKLKDLTPGQMAMLAGLPQRPADANPVANLKRATARQHLVLRRMRDLNVLSTEQYETAIHEDLGLVRGSLDSNSHAQYVAEMVRQQIYAQYKEDTYTSGITVYTTLIKAEQDAAYEAVRRQVIAYDQRHGFRGPEVQLDLPINEEEKQSMIDEAYAKLPKIERMPLALVKAASAKSVKVETQAGEELEISGDGLRFAQTGLAKNASNTLRVRPGSIVRLMIDGKGRWAISQLPQVAAGFAALNAQTGGFRALVGGFNYNMSKFNHVTQAWRQPGSSIKPFIYSAAVDKGFWPGTMINDTPLTIGSGETGSAAWSPQNDDNEYSGEISMRNALAKSKNVVSVRILQAIGMDYGHEFLGRFGFDLDKHPKNLTMSLGTGSVTVQQMAGAYAVFANGGYKVTPYLVAKIVDGKGKVLFAAPPAAQDESNRVLDARNAFLTEQMMRQVTISGTAAIASQRLGRRDLAGKTGTTSDALDGWFAGYVGNAVAVAWMGYDDPRSLGGREFGATLALPIWVDYMRAATNGKGPQERVAPPGVDHVDGDWLMSDFVNNGLVRQLGLRDSEAAPENTPAPNAANQANTPIPVPVYNPPSASPPPSPPPRALVLPPYEAKH